MIVLLALCAHAQSLHPGIPLDEVSILGPAQFLTPDLGWSAPVDGGFVKGFVGDSEQQAAQWLQAAQMSITVQLPAVSGIGDVAYGDPQGLLLVQHGNIAFEVRSDGNAQEVAQTLLDAIPSLSVPWPSSPTVVEQGGQWVVLAPEAVYIQQDGPGRRLPEANGVVFTEQPSTVVVWDRYGRPSVWEARRD